MFRQRAAELSAIFSLFLSVRCFSFGTQRRTLVLGWLCDRLQRSVWRSAYNSFSRIVRLSRLGSCTEYFRRNRFHELKHERPGCQKPCVSRTWFEILSKARFWLVSTRIPEIRCKAACTGAESEPPSGTLIPFFLISAAL